MYFTQEFPNLDTEGSNGTRKQGKNKQEYYYSYYETQEHK